MRTTSLSAAAMLVFLLASAHAGEKEAKTIALFDGKSLDGWSWTSRDGKTPVEKVWSVKEGVLVCTGRPAGYIRTKKEFSDYKLTLEWRWNPESEGRRNSGVLIHTVGKDEVWPKSIESQLMAGNAGDFWAIGGTTIDIPDADKRVMGRRHLNLTDGSEKPIGQWNTKEITCRGGEIIVKVNGELVNHARNASVTKGAICLQSEGAEIHFRNVRLTPLE